MQNSPSKAAAPGAGDTRDWLGVHELTEFIYCPRAGLIAHAQGASDNGQESDAEPWASLSYVPPYDLTEITAAIRKVETRLWRWAPLALPAVLAAVYAYFRLGVAWLALALVAYLLVFHVANLLVRFLHLYWFRWHVEHVKEQVPDPRLAEDQPVDWWAMLRAGFDSIPYGEDHWMKSENLLLAGRPWRVLRRGSLRIPVFWKRCRGKKNGHVVRDQHYIRIAAYCHLLRESEPGVECPYGIILFDDSYLGWALHVQSETRDEALRSALKEARGVLSEAGQKRFPKPAPRAKCLNCPLGRPIVHRPGGTEMRAGGVLLPIYGVSGKDGRTYHSACGDMFGWLPPHERAAEKGLTDTLAAKDPEKEFGISTFQRE